MQEPDSDFRQLAARYGRTAARRIFLNLRAATRGLVSTLRHSRIACALADRDSIYFTLDAEKLPGLREEFRQRKAAGLRGRWLSAEALRHATGIAGLGAIRTAGNAQLDPIAACAGLVTAAAARGARIFEKSAVLQVRSAARGVDVKTERGVIRARRVLIATGYATPRFKPGTGRFRLQDTYVMVTRKPRPGEGIPARAGKTMLWDTDRPYHYVRWTADGQLMLGGEDTPHRARSGRAIRLARGRRRLLKYLGRIYPAFEEERPAFVWQGLFIQTPDGLPYIGTHPRYPRHLFALGYGGNGMTASYLAATFLLRRYLGRPHPDEKLFAFDRWI
jgi:glycine/D-amino acid oxidase-like deaminating enzyme